MKISVALALSIVVAVVPRLSCAGLELAPLFRDRAVLQCDAAVPVWGRAAPGADVTVHYLGATARTKAEASGRWKTRLGPFAAGRSGSFTVTAGADTIELHDVVAGEVWLCAGQSNLQMPVRSAQHAAEAAATISAGADIREFDVGIRVSATPRQTADGEWTRCSAQTVGSFSAVAYFFAQEIQPRLHRPIGLIVTAKGGSPLESWLSPELLRSEAATPLLLHWRDQLARRKPVFSNPRRPPFVPVETAMSPVGPGGFAEPGVLYNGMLYPLIPYAVRGMVWYQGEANVSPDFLPAAEYGPWFRRMISDWRAKWAQDLPFYFVQLPANAMPDRDLTGVEWATLRQAQASALALPKTAMAVTIDLGDAEVIHPTVKREVGERLGLIALRRTYRCDDIIDAGPMFQAAAMKDGGVRIQFQFAGGKLSTRDGKAPAGLEWAGSDGRFVPASCRIDGSSVHCEVGSGIRVRAVRYAWAQNPGRANLCGPTGLPAAPFWCELP